MAEPPFAALAPAPVIGSRLGWTKILMPLLQPVVILKSTTSSKFESRSRVMMSPPACASALPLVTTESSPSLISQLWLGNSSDFGLRHPSIVLPPQSNRQPAACSGCVSVLGAAQDFWQQVEHEVVRPATSPKIAVMANAGRRSILNFMVLI